MLEAFFSGFTRRITWRWWLLHKQKICQQALLLLAAPSLNLEVQMIHFVGPFMSYGDGLFILLVTKEGQVGI